jgi:hypothetical protein
MRSTLPALCLALSACHHHHRDGHSGVPVFREEEPNDDALTANHFGVIRPGDRFVIEGFVRDDDGDRFDGFAFTAERPLHVDFQLFADHVRGRPAADLDVCLFDPQDESLDCFATTEDPERGGVDVFAGGLDFHLVVESFLGDAGYALEIVVQPLFAATASDSPAGRSGSASGLSAVDARAERRPRAELGYKQRPAERRPVLELEHTLELDLERREALVIVRRRCAA